MRADTRIRGVVTALGTPLDEQDNLHEQGLRIQIQQQIKAGVHALLVCGSMGAMQLLTDETYIQTLEVASDEVRGRVPLIAGCGDCSTARTLRRIRWAEQNGMDAVALVPPYFFKFTDVELLSYFTEISEHSPLPVYLYDNPAFTKHSLEFELIVELAKLPNIHGLKASGDLFTLRRCAEKFRNDRAFVVLSGQTCYFDLSLQLGAAGIVDGLFSVAPELAVRLWESFQTGDYAGAAEAERKIIRLIDIVRVDSVFGGFTAAMNLRGVPGNFAIRPFHRTTAEGRTRVGQILREVGIAL